MTTKSFIEDQFPVLLLSKESYKERMAGIGQTLNGVGKWWGRKPLVMVRATIIGLVLQSSKDPHKDLDIFLRLMTMDTLGLWTRKCKSISQDTIARNINREQVFDFFLEENNKFKFLNNLCQETKKKLEFDAFCHMSYDEKLNYSYRPEEIEGPPYESWEVINEHCGTKAYSLRDWINQSSDFFGKDILKIGDAFAGGGSVPFEAARLGVPTLGSELNPFGSLLTWSSLNILGGDLTKQRMAENAQNRILEKLDQSVTNWGIEHNDKGWRGEVYIYCFEIKSPSSGYWVPLAPSWIIDQQASACAYLQPDPQKSSFNIRVVENADSQLLNQAKKGTIQNGKLVDPITGSSHSISTLRGDRGDKKNGVMYGLRMWDNQDIVPRSTDTFQERLYCIRYLETQYKVVKDTNIELNKGEILSQNIAENFQNFDSLIKSGTLKPLKVRRYIEPDEDDIKREDKVLSILKERFSDWQKKGFIPSSKIPIEKNKEETPRLAREKGWTYWHHLFNPRQLLYDGLINYYAHLQEDVHEKVAGLLLLGKVTNLSSRISRWLGTDGTGRVKGTFYNQALNTFFNYGCRGVVNYHNLKVKPRYNLHLDTERTVHTYDAKEINESCDIWILDPPYADAVNYHELGDFFLSWMKSGLKQTFEDWHQDSRAALALKGRGENFNTALVKSLLNLRENMPNNGFQVLMFTHQDTTVWSNLALVIWASSLKVSNAWTIQTETDTGGIKKGTTVQGTVIMVLRKQLENEVGFLNDIYADIDDEVKQQVDFMRDLDREGRNVFSDPDYQLAAYASALKVLTQFSEIEGINLQQELNRPQNDKNANPVKDVINQALTVAMDYMVPKGFPEAAWRKLTPKERFYLKGLQVEAGNEYRSGVYEEMARGFGIPEYKFMLNARANATRLKTPKELGNQYLQSGEFADSFLREVLYAINRTHRDENAESGRNHLYAELDDYWGKRTMAIEVLNFIYNTTAGPKHWEQEREACNVLSGYLSNDTPD